MHVTAGVPALAAELKPDRSERARALADLYACLAQAFLPPAYTLERTTWLSALADDLAELDCVLALGLDEAIAVLRQYSARGEGDAWLVEYSRLFVVPPVPVSLNTGVYLEGGLSGHSAQMLRQCYMQAGYAPDEQFRDLPDHVAMQLEFLSLLYQRAADGDIEAQALADDFMRAFVAGWASALRLACERQVEKHDAAQVFAALAWVIELVEPD